MNDYKFGNFIYDLRKRNGISQTELAELLGVTNKAVSKWKMAKQSLKQKFFKKWLLTLKFR